MEAVIFIGIQGSGKSTFYKERFFDTHVRINLDMLKTRHRERLLVNACLDAKQAFVVDNTNVRHRDRGRYLEPALTAGFRVVGYFFQPDADRALAWNAKRHDKPPIPTKGVLGTLKALQSPGLDEGFHQLFRVQVDTEGRFRVEEWAG